MREKMKPAIGWEGYGRPLYYDVQSSAELAWRTNAVDSRPTHRRYWIANAMIHTHTDPMTNKILLIGDIIMETKMARAYMDCDEHAIRLNVGEYQMQSHVEDDQRIFDMILILVDYNKEAGYDTYSYLASGSEWWDEHEHVIDEAMDRHSDYLLYPDVFASQPFATRLGYVNQYGFIMNYYNNETQLEWSARRIIESFAFSNASVNHYEGKKGTDGRLFMV